MDTASLPRRRRSDQGENERIPPTKQNKVRALTDFWYFIDMLGFQGGSSNFGECHLELVKWSDTHNSLKELILMPRGHLKSTLMTVARTLHRIYQNPNIRIFVGTATKELAGAFVREIKSYLEDPWLQQHVWNDRPHYPGRLIPSMERGGQRKSRASMSSEEFERDLWDESSEAEDKKTVWRGTALQVLRPYIMKEPTVTVGAVGVQPTGFHFDELRLDDVINYDNVMTVAKRAKVISWIDDLISVLDDPYIDDDFKQTLINVGISEEVAESLAVIAGRITVCGTRYDREDWYSTILQRIKENTTKYVVYQRNIYKNGQDKRAGYLWWEKWDERVEADKRSEMTAQRFASQYLNVIVAIEEQILSPDSIRRFNASQVKYLDGRTVRLTVSEDEHYDFIPKLIIDPAAAVGDDSDFTALVVGGKSKEGALILLEGAIGRWTASQATKKIFEFADKWKLSSISVETVSGFKHFAQFIRASFHLHRPIAVHEFRPSGKKEIRISNALEPLFANGLMFCSRYILNSDEIRDQFLFFPRPTIHDDFPDVVSALCELSKPPLAKPVRRLAGSINKDYGGYR
jgi:predicted phage terminase large subunit-like protein